MAQETLSQLHILNSRVPYPEQAANPAPQADPVRGLWKTSPIGSETLYVEQIAKLTDQLETLQQSADSSEANEQLISLLRERIEELEAEKDQADAENQRQDDKIKQLESKPTAIADGTDDETDEKTDA